MNQYGSDNLVDRLRARLAQPLPGRGAQRRFAPELSFGRHNGPSSHDVRLAAVMVLFCRAEFQWYLPLTLRPDHLSDHAGQVSFPGGAVDAGESSQAAAVRELEEELGISPDDVEILGRLSKIHLFNSNFLVTPWVAVTRRAPPLSPNAAEVAEAIELPLDVLVDRTHHGRHQIHRQGISFTAPHIRCGRHRIWGATAMMLGELISILDEIQSGLART